MQTTELEPALSRAISATEKAGWQLVIANKNYSSWSMRPWVALRAFEIPFQEICVHLDREDTAGNIARHSPSGRVPVLKAGKISVWDSLAICEFAAEQFPEKNLWPQNVQARAIARSICAEMHSGFNGLRSSMWMNIRARFPGKGRTSQAQADIGRICELWEECLSQFGHHHFLFGDFSIADAYFAPVAMRFITYDVALAPALQAYVERVTAHPAVAEWIAGALSEVARAPRYDVYPE